MNPIVSVALKQIKTRPFLIQGAVKNPGPFQIEGRPSILKLITVAGGLNDNYGSTAFVIREKPQTEDPAVTGNGTKPDPDDEGRYELIKININSLLRGNFDQNIIIRPNDIVYIPKSDIFFVAGEVKAPGNFPLREGTTLRQAISLAQGTKFEGATDRGIIFREDQRGKREEIMVDIGAVMAGKKPDIDIQPNDIIMVPNNKTKTIANGMFRTITDGFLRTVVRY